MTTNAARYTAANTLLALDVVEEDDPGLDQIAGDLADAALTGARPVDLEDVLSAHGVIGEDPDFDPDGHDIALAVHAALTHRADQEPRAA